MTRKGLSASEIADQLGVTPRQVVRYRADMRSSTQRVDA